MGSWNVLKACLLLFAAAVPLLASANNLPRLGVADPFPTDTLENIETRLNLYQQAGINLLRVEVDWRDLERTEGTWSDTPVLGLLESAKRHGFQVKATIGGLCGPPGWLFKAHPEAQMTNEVGFKSTNVISYWYPDLRRLLTEKDARVFDYLASKDLLNNIAYLVVPLGPGGEPLYPVPWTTSRPEDPMRFWFFDTYAQADFPRKMQEKYHSIDAANQAWGTRFQGWDAVRIPEPSSVRGAIWRDVLEWYRDSKRAFIEWQIVHYQNLVKKYFGTGQIPKLLILVPGGHLSSYRFDAAVRSGGGEDGIKMMADSDFLLDLAHRAGASVQYTGMPNMRELEYLETHIRENRYDLPMWGENSGNKGDPLDLDQEVFLNQLFGQEYIGNNLFEADHVTPSQRYFQLKSAHMWLTKSWESPVVPELELNSLPLYQATCIYGNTRRDLSLCMQSDGNLVLKVADKVRWATGTNNRNKDFCSPTEDPLSICRAEFQADGNFVVYHGQQVLWSSGTAKRGNRLIVEAQAPNLEIRDSEGHVVWAAK